MSVHQVSEQPSALQGHHYRLFPLEEYTWFELRTGDGEVYAVCGLAVGHGEAWMYWRILRPGLKAWRELKRNDVPWMQDYWRQAGARVAKVMTEDPADVNFDKMVRLMGFNVVKMGWQSLEAGHVW